MIDFRYHVVSLVSVFLALAVGIVLGAGPLQKVAGDALRHEVQQLRIEKADLRSTLTDVQADGRHYDDYLRAVEGSLTVGALTGRTVLVVALPGVSSGDVAAAVQAIEQAGGVVPARMTISDALTSIGGTDQRVRVLGAIAAVDPLATASATDTASELAAVLARSVMTTQSPGTPGLPASTEEVIKQFTSSNLISVAGSLREGSYGALLLAPDVPVDTGSSPRPSATADQVDRLRVWTAFAKALDARGGGAVVLGSPSTAGAGGLLHALRQDQEAVAHVSTVDEAATPMGVITAVLALREQFKGLQGSYGFAGGATAPLPDGNS